VRWPYILAILLLLAASPARATPGWDKYVSSTGFSLEYPRRWAATNNRSNTYRDNGKYPDFVLRDGPDGPPHHGAVVLERWQAELRVREIDSPIDFDRIYANLESDETISRQFHEYDSKEHYRVLDLSLRPGNGAGCASAKEIIYKDEIGGGGPRASDSRYTQDYDFYCTIGDRSFLVALMYWPTDRRAKELQRVAFRVVKSLQLEPPQSVHSPTKRPPTSLREPTKPQ